MFERADYTGRFYEEVRGGARTSAEVVLPRVFEWIAPSSVIDVGCGTGAWLAVARELGAGRIRGVEGPRMDPEELEVPPDSVVQADLECPLHLSDRFDLVISLEVAEHLRPAAAGVFVDTLTRLGPAVLFSAAIPFQGGVHHVNEQWPAYWTERFRERGFEAVGDLRGELWEDPHVEWWYRQNLLLFVERELVESSPVLAVLPRGKAVCLPLVHPGNYLRQARLAARGGPLPFVREIARGLRRRFRRSWRRGSG